LCFLWQPHYLFNPKTPNY